MQYHSDRFRYIYIYVLIAALYAGINQPRSRSKEARWRRLADG